MISKGADVLKGFYAGHRFAIASFLAIGLFAWVVYLSLFFLLERYFHIRYSLATTVAYFTGTVVHFIMNRMITFQQRAGRATHQLGRYLVLLSFNYVMTMVIVSLCVEVLGLPAYYGVILSAGLSVVMGYFVSHGWIFRHDHRI